jgi:hypothetical protein
MNETISNMNFLKDTIGKFKDEIQKFIINPQHGNLILIKLLTTLSVSNKT